MPTDDSDFFSKTFSFVPADQKRIHITQEHFTGSIKFQYLFRNGERYTMMNSENYEQLELTESEIGPAAIFLKEGQEDITAIYVIGFFLGVQLPEFVELVVVSATYSPAENDDNLLIATLETGAQLTVPSEVLIGQKIRISSVGINLLQRFTLTMMILVLFYRPFAR